MGRSTSIIQKNKTISNNSSYSSNKFFDPINPNNPFFMHHPKLQNSLELKLDKKEDLNNKQIKQRNLQLSNIGPTNVAQSAKEILQEVLPFLTGIKNDIFKLSYKKIIF